MKQQPGSEAEFVEINGIQQYLLHTKSKAAQAPVLLFLHGGPGMSEAAFAYAFQPGWQAFYTVVHWDQPGAGKTLTKNKNTYPGMEELLGHLRGVVQYLKAKYQTEKIVLLGHSFGSILGSLYALRYPQDVLYYIGAGQVVSLMENERAGYQKVKELILSAGNQRDLQKLEKLGAYPQQSYDQTMMKKMQSIRMLQGKYKIGMEFGPILKTLLKSPTFQLSDLGSLVKGLSNNKALVEFLFSHSLANESLAYQVPVYYLLGDRDFQAPYPVAQAYFETIQAPQKQLWMVENAGHFMMLDQPAAFTRRLAALQTQAAAAQPTAG